MYEIETRSCERQHFLAGDFPIVKEVLPIKTGEVINGHEPVKVIDGQAEPVTLMAESAADASAGTPAASAAENTVRGLAGISAASSNGETVVIYRTGEFYADALIYREGVTAEMLKEPFAQLNIYLK